MKTLLAFFSLLLLVSCTNAPTKKSDSQQVVINDSTRLRKDAANPYAQVDVSPMDMVYFPADYPIKKMNGEVATLPQARVIYSRPHRGGRQLFGNLVKWGQPWRLGANEATEIEFFQPVTIQNQRVDKGIYLLYAIPYENHWTVVLNKNLYAWGLKFNPADDVMKFDIPSVTKPQLIEYFTMDFEKTAAGTALLMAWEDREARLPIQF